MSKLLSPLEVRRLVTEEVERLYKRRADNWAPIELPTGKNPEPVPTRAMYKQVTGSRRLADPPPHSTMTAHERARIIAQIFSVVRKSGLK